MKPVSPAPDDDHLRKFPARPASESSDSTIEKSDPEKTDPEKTESMTEEAEHQPPAPANLTTPTVSFSGQLLAGQPSSTGPSLSGQLAGPLEKLQRRYTDQLSQDIEGLEAQKSQLERDVATLKAEHDQLQADLPKAEDSTPTQDQNSQLVATNDAVTESGPRPANVAATSKLPSGPRLPGESPEAVPVSTVQRNRSIELPTPSTSEQRRQSSIQLREPGDIVKANPRKGVILSAIAIVLMGWHYSLISTLGQGGSWLGFPVGELGSGFVPTVALLWLRMLVTVPVLGLLAPQLHKDTWEDLQNWIYTRDRLLIMLIGSGIALFFSQVLIYQCVGVIGPVLGVTLLFLYPLTAVPLGALVAQEQKMTPLGWLALVAIAMGGVLAMRPFFGGEAPTSATLGLGLGASVAFSLYIVLTNRAYRQQCHPVPVGVVQFSTVAVLSSLVLLVKPLRLANISWLGLTVWGLLLGSAMLLVYLLTYSSLRMIGPRTAIIAAATPLVTALVSIGFSPWAPLEIIQWTGVFMVAIGGIALGKEKLSSRP